MQITLVPVSACATHYIEGRFVIFLFTVALKRVKHCYLTCNLIISDELWIFKD